MPTCQFKLPAPYFHRQPHLPLVMIDTFGTPIPDEPKISAHMRILKHKHFAWFPSWVGRDYGFDAVDFDGSIGIEIRGQSSQQFPKKSYGFETRDATGGDLSVSLLGLPAESDWVLHGPYTDKTLLRNFLAYALSNKMGQYASRTRFVEVYLKLTGSASPEEQYVGVYVLEEKIKRGPQRIAITPLTQDQNAEPEVSGGYILKIDKIDPTDLFFTTTRGTRIIHVYPKPDKITIQQRAWIQNYVEAFENALSGPDFENPSIGYNQYIYTSSFVDYVLINEVLRNVDAFRISTYMYKDRSDKLTMGPVWDFDISMGNCDYYEGWKTDGWLIGSIPASDNFQQPFWWQSLLGSEIFVHWLIHRWLFLRTEQLDLANLFTFIDHTIVSLYGAHFCNIEKWDKLGERIWPNYPPYPESYEGEIERLKTWLEGRIHWIDENIYFLLP